MSFSFTESMLIFSGTGAPMLGEICELAEDGKGPDMWAYKVFQRGFYGFMSKEDPNIDPKIL